MTFNPDAEIRSGNTGRAGSRMPGGQGIAIGGGGGCLLLVVIVLYTLLGFVAIYTALIVVEMKLMLGAIRKGPQPDTPPAAPADVPLIGKVQRTAS